MNDEQLLDQLRATLFADPGLDPPALLRSSLRRAAVGPVGIAPRRRHRAVVGLAVGISSLGVTSAAFAFSGTPLPPVLRQVAHTAHLPVDSPQLAHALDSRRLLRNAITGNDTVQITAAAHRLRADLEKLASGERDAVQPEADNLLRIGDEHAQAGTDPNQPQGDHGSNAPTGQSGQRRTGGDGQQHGPSDNPIRRDGSAGSGDGGSSSGSNENQPTPVTPDEQSGVTQNS